MKKEYFAHKSLFNFDANYVAGACYIIPLIQLFINLPSILGILMSILPIFIYVMEKDSDFVRFHAMQSFILNFCFLRIFTGFLLILGLVGLFQLRLIGLLALFLDIIVSIGIICLSIYSTIQAFNYWTTEIPLLSSLLKKILKW